jgi:hypothetical protein
MPGSAETTSGPSPARRIRLAFGSLARFAPGGSSLLRLRRRSIAAARRRIYPVRPPLHDAERVAALSVTPDDHPFITGNALAARCRFVINYDDLHVNEDIDNDWWFCQSEFLEYFFAKHEPTKEYVLFSHNSDRPIDRGLRRFLRRPALRAWFSVNVATRHPKLHAIPIGIADPRWRHGDGATLARVQSEDIEKMTLFDASYDLSTYPPAREYCRDQTGVDPVPRREFGDYLRAVASSYFCIAPRGHGIDTHRVWEALYLRTVPVVTSSVLTEQLADLPMIVLDDWSDFRSIEFGSELYARTWGSWDPESLTINRYLKRVEALAASN